MRLLAHAAGALIGSVVPLVLSATAAAQRLPLRRFDAAEGLPSGRVNTLLQDAHGFLWAGTWEGLSRHDGERFESYGRSAGLANPLVTTLALDPDGGLWLGTYGGLAHLSDAPLGAQDPLFEFVDLGTGLHAERIGALAFDGDGGMWCGALSGLFHVARDPEGRLAGRRVLPEGVGWPGLFTRDRAGKLWCATNAALVRLEHGEVVERIDELPDGAGSVIAFVADGRGGHFVVADGAVREAAPGALGRPAEWRALPLPLLPDERARSGLVDAAGTLWVGTTRGLLAWRDGRAERLGVADGLPDDIVLALCEDRDRNLWIGTSAQGILRLSTRAIRSWTVESGLPSANVLAIVRAADGTLVASTQQGLALLEPSGARALRGGPTPFAPGISLHQDRRGGWWAIERGTVWFVPGPELALERAVRLDQRHGLPQGTSYGTILEDARGAIWIATLPRSISHWTPDGSDEPRFTSIELTGSDAPELAPRVMLELADGTQLLAPFQGFYKREGRELIALAPRPDDAQHEVRTLLLDRRGDLWIGTRFEGLFRWPAPLSTAAQLEREPALEALPSAAVFALVEDLHGGLWVGTGRGLVRHDADGRLAYYGLEEGLAGPIVHGLLVDPAGDVWAATSGGASRIDLDAPEHLPAAPDVVLTGVRVAGVARPMPARGARQLDLRELASGEDNLLLEFAAPCHRREGELALEYRLGAAGPWNTLGNRRSLGFAGLAPGAYRVEVRARNGAGLSGTPAVLSFELAPPFWRTGAFAILLAAVVLSVAWMIHRARVARLVALEAVRRQIAGDVHDELGAGLAQIAVLAEVARRDATPAAAGRLAEAARVARALRESMSDIVWAVDPRQDSLASLIERVRHLAHNLFEAQGAEVRFETPAESVLAELALAPDRRRQLHLVLKEALTNVARHARANLVCLAFRLDGGRLEVEVQDDGAGFDPAAVRAGHGLAGMRARVAGLGGVLELESRAAAGTRLVLRVPL